jgi:hypothetical protein
MPRHTLRKFFWKNGDLGLENDLAGSVGVEEVVPIIFAQEAARKINATRGRESESDVSPHRVTEPFQVRHDLLPGEAGESREMRSLRRRCASLHERYFIVGLTFVSLRRQSFSCTLEGVRRERFSRRLDWWSRSCGR